MSFAIRYSPAAQHDIDDVWNSVYNASKDYDTADKYVTELTKTISQKKEFPHSGTPLRYRGLFTGFYYVVYKKYLAFYRVNDNYIEVLRVIMSKRDYMTILFNMPED